MGLTGCHDQHTWSAQLLGFKCCASNEGFRDQSVRFNFCESLREAPCSVERTSARGIRASVTVQKQWGLPMVSIVVPFGGYLLGSLIKIWLNQDKELQWRL